MLDVETKRKIRELAVPGMVDILDLMETDAAYASLSFDERMKIVIDHTYSQKMNDDIVRLIKNAKFRLPDADIVNIDYEGRPLNRALITELGRGYGHFFGLHQPF